MRARITVAHISAAAHLDGQPGQVVAVQPALNMAHAPHASAAQRVVRGEQGARHLTCATLPGLNKATRSGGASVHAGAASPAGDGIKHSDGARL